MKRIGYYSILLFLCPLYAGEKYVLDEIRAVVSTKQTTAIVLTSDIRPALTGEPRTLRDLIIEQLMLLDAHRLNIVVSDDDVEKYIKQLQKNNGSTPEEIDELFKALGYNSYLRGSKVISEGREQLRRKEIIDQLLAYRIQNNKKLAITKQDVEAFWATHAPWQDASFTLTTAFVPSTKNSADFESSLKTETQQQPINWQTPFAVKASGLAEDKQYIMNKKIGDIVLIEPVKEGFELTKLLSKSEKMLEPLYTGNDEEDKKRYATAEQTLRQERIKEILFTYECDLLSTATIQFTHEADRKAVYEYTPPT